MLLARRMRAQWLLAACVGLGIALFGAVAPAAESLSAAGATFPYPLYSKWFSVYQQKAGVEISYQAIGSGGGIRALKSGTVDFGASDAPLSDAEMKDMPGYVVHLPTVAGAVAIAYNLPGVDKGLKLSSDVVADMFLGNIRRWNDRRITALNPGVKLPDLPVAVVHRSDGSGTSYIFTSYLERRQPRVVEARGLRQVRGLAHRHRRLRQRRRRRRREADPRLGRLRRAGLRDSEPRALRGTEEPRGQVRRAE